MLDTAEDGDLFGDKLASGDFNADGAAELAVGVPDEDLDGTSDAGAVQVLCGRPILFVDGFESGDTAAWASTFP